jgi:RluA family pseudouridine synthase
MSEHKLPKLPPKKYQPSGLTILYEDQEIIVVDKAPGLLTIGTDREKERTAHYLLNDYVMRGNAKSKNRVYIVHRLDRETSGILVFAKNEQSRQFLQENWQDFAKKYVAVVQGKLKHKQGEITTYLMENKALRVYSVKDITTGQLARTGFKVLKENEEFSLLEIDLFTGRKHQIRVHLSEKGHPVLGDKIYGTTAKGPQRLALHSSYLRIIHPFKKKEMVFETEIPGYFTSFFQREKGEGNLKK